MPIFKISSVKVLSFSSIIDVSNKFIFPINSLTNLFDQGNNSLYEISNLMNSLDLVISSDTSIIHLAGILNINSVLLLNYNSDWRWFDDSKSTIWYPSIKILKQNKFDDWTNVFVELKEILKNYISDKKKGQ